MTYKLLQEELSLPSRIYGNDVEPSHLFVFLHGYGASKDDLIDLAEIFSQDFPNACFLSPDAIAPCDMGMGRQWFSLGDFSVDAIGNGVGHASSGLSQYLQELREKFSVTTDKIVLIGFSQGTMLALHYATRHEPDFAAIIGFSGLLPHIDDDNVKKDMLPPICLVHGEQDDVVPFSSMSIAKQSLTQMGAEVSSLSRPGLGHGIDMEGINFARTFLRSRLI